MSTPEPLPEPTSLARIANPENAVKPLGVYRREERHYGAKTTSCGYVALAWRRLAWDSTVAHHGRIGSCGHWRGKAPVRARNHHNFPRLRRAISSRPYASNSYPFWLSAMEHQRGQRAGSTELGKKQAASCRHSTKLYRAANKKLAIINGQRRSLKRTRAGVQHWQMIVTDPTRRATT